MIPLINPQGNFPPVETALTSPNGLLCASESLHPEQVKRAYQQGIFPWYSDDEPVLWWSPDPRCIIKCSDIHISRSMARFLKNSTLTFKINTQFKSVVEACAEPRPDQDETWITKDIIEVYFELHQQGIAHSIECWDNDQLVGGVYGISVNRVFCGESMFSKSPNASKAALIYIAQQLDYDYIDCQIPNDHLSSMGAVSIPRTEFIELLHSL